MRNINVAKYHKVNGHPGILASIRVKDTFGLFSGMKNWSTVIVPKTLLKKT
jgi:hypothetical protein